MKDRISLPWLWTLGFALAALICAISPALAAPVVSIALTPNTGVAPYPATLTWTVTGATSCTAADGWSGSQAASGTKAVTVAAATKYTLTCTAADGQVLTTITAPTANTDGSPLTDLAGFNVYRGTTATNLTKVKSLGPNVLTYLQTDLAPGPYYISVTAVNAASIESVQGKTAPFPLNVVGSTSSASATAAIQTVPNAPASQSTTISVSTQVSVTTGP